MCKLGIFPPGVSPGDAIHTMRKQGAGNLDGTGSMWVKNGVIEYVKTDLALNKALKAGTRLFDHMPHDGWTVVHLRAASTGKSSVDNAHPFVFGDWGVAHNGQWSHHKIVRLAASKHAKFAGDTDSEVAAWLINEVGPVEFQKNIQRDGVFACLNKKGELWIAKDGWNLYMEDIDQGTVFTTDDIYNSHTRFDDGVIGLTKDMGLLEWTETSPLPVMSRYHGNTYDPLRETWYDRAVTPSHESNFTKYDKHKSDSDRGVKTYVKNDQGVWIPEGYTQEDMEFLESQMSHKEIQDMFSDEYGYGMSGDA